MSNDKNNEFAGEILTPEIARKAIYELGKVDRVPPTVGIFDSPTRCFVVNQEWWSHIAGMVHLLADVVSWRDAEDESYFAIQEILRFMQGMECMEFQLRQDPVDNCMLQQTLDGGDTWTDVFDFSQCVTIQDKSYQISIQNQVTNVQETFIDIYNNYTTNYAGLPSDVYPDLATPPAGTDDSALKAALCNAIWELIRTACNAAVSYYTESINQQQNEANFLLAVAAFTLTALALAAAVPTAGASLVALGAAAPLIALGVGLGAGLANYLVDFWQQHTIDQFQDTEAMEEVACYLVDELEAGNKSLAAMQAALVGHGLTGNAGVIADFLKILLSHDSTYAAFLEKWNNNLQYAEAGIDLYCPCASGYKVWVWEFANGMGEFTIDSGHGTFENGRIKGQDIGTSKSAVVRMAFDPTWRVKGVAINNERINGIGNGNQDTRGAVLQDASLNTAGDQFLMTGGFLGNGERYDCATKAGATYGTGGHWFMAQFKVNDNASSNIYIDKIKIVFYEDFAKGGYTTDDGDICS